MPASQPKSSGSGKSRIFRPNPQPLSKQPDPTGWDESKDSQMGMTKAVEEAGETGSSANEPRED